MRTLTDQHKRRLQAGRRKASDRQRREHRKQIATYGAWLKRESHAYEELLRAREMFGEHSTEARAAAAAWHRELKSMPPMSSLPKDWAWRELRDENG